MKRRLFYLESFIYGNGDQPFNAVLTVKIKGEPSLPNLRLALAKVQQRHPLLRSDIIFGRRGRPWFITAEKPAAIPVRLVDRRSDEQWLAESRKEWHTPFDAAHGPLIRMVWIKGPAVSELLMVFHHSISNGGSAVCLLHEILTLWDEPSFFTGKDLGYVTQEKLLAGLTIDSKTRRKARLQSLAAQLVLTWKSAFVSVKNGPSLNREKDYAIHWKLDAGASAALYQQCRERKVTVNTAFCAAFLTAFRTVRGAENYKSITCPVDIRRYLPNLDKEDLFAFAMAITLPIPENAPTDVWALAGKMQQDATEKMQRLDAASYLLPMEYAHGTIRPMLKLLRYSKPGLSLLLSNMGKLPIQTHYGSLEIETVYSFTVIGPFGDPTGIVTSTFEGRMDFCLMSNEDIMPYADALSIKEKATSLLTSTILI